MSRIYFLGMLLMIPMSLFGDDDFDTLSIRPVGLDYSKYNGTDKLYVVGECAGMTGTQIVVFQNRPSFDYFQNDEIFKAEQKELEKALWQVILDKDARPIVVKGRWHQYNDRMIFLSHKILQLKRGTGVNP